LAPDAGRAGRTHHCRRNVGLTKEAEKLWNDDQRDEFIDFIAAHPKAGDVIPGTGGVRKLRWIIQGSGKRGGARVIYFFYDRNVPIYLLMVYSKRARENFSPAEKQTLRKETGAMKQALRRPQGRTRQ